MAKHGKFKWIQLRSDEKKLSRYIQVLVGQKEFKQIQLNITLYVVKVDMSNWCI